jgi:hypothetical protein
MAINYRKTALEEQMLLNLQKHTWTSGLTLRDFRQHEEMSSKALEEFKNLSAKYDKNNYNLFSYDCVKHNCYMVIFPADFINTIDLIES